MIPSFVPNIQSKPAFFLSCLLAIEPATELLILEDPTNNLELRSLEELSCVLAGYAGALLLSTHDAEFAHDVVVEESIYLKRTSDWYFALPLLSLPRIAADERIA
jgi:ATPase subunit of ABC transporter with duplicated ATPase domains